MTWVAKKGLCWMRYRKRRWSILARRRVRGRRRWRRAATVNEGHLADDGAAGGVFHHLVADHDIHRAFEQDEHDVAGSPALKSVSPGARCTVLVSWENKSAGFMGQR